MSKPLTPHDASGIVAYDQDGNIAWQQGTTVPTDTTTGYCTGCIFQKTDGGVGTSLYVNEGTSASSDFNAK